jgi:hypothetical protein
MSVDDIVSAYGAAWLEPAEEQRRQLLARAWAEDGTYTDPIRHVEGRDALNQTIAAFQQRRPGERIVLTSGVDHHHGVVRFAWAWCHLLSRKRDSLRLTLSTRVKQESTR